MNQQYEIATVNDFLAVPEEKIAACLADFHSWIAMMRTARDLNAAIDRLIDQPGAASLVTSNFVWVDDGIEGLSGINFLSDGQVIGSINVHHDKENR